MIQIVEGDDGPRIDIEHRELRGYAAVAAHCEMLFGVAALMWPDDHAAYLAVDEPFRADDEPRAPAAPANGRRGATGADGLTDQRRAIHDATREGLSLAETAARVGTTANNASATRQWLRKHGHLP